VERKRRRYQRCRAAEKRGFFSGIKSREITPGAWMAVGWSVLPDVRRPSDAVLLTFDNNRDEPVIFGFGRMGVPQEDVGRSSDDLAYEKAGWYGQFDQSTLPKDARTIKAWALNAETGRAYRIKGEINLQP
jgi:hypothetical protein